MDADRNAVIQEQVPYWRAYLHTVAWNALGHDHPAATDADDLAQEGLIAMWQAVDAWDDTRGVPLPEYMKWRAARRIHDIAAERAHMVGAQDTGMARTKHSPQASGIEARARIRGYLREHPDATGRQIAAALGMSEATLSYHRKRLHDDTEAPAGTVSLTALLDDGLDLAGAGDVLDGIVTAYMDGLVAEALDVLTPAEHRYVVLRFWHGAQSAELTEAFGYAPHGLWRTAKARLRPVLAELAPA